MRAIESRSSASSATTSASASRPSACRNAAIEANTPGRSNVQTICNILCAASSSVLAVAKSPRRRKTSPCTQWPRPSSSNTFRVCPALTRRKACARADSKVPRSACIHANTTGPNDEPYPNASSGSAEPSRIRSASSESPRNHRFMLASNTPSMSRNRKSYRSSDASRPMMQFCRPE
mgnify:CR=1 FL=1